MKTIKKSNNEALAAAAFSKQSAIFDELYRENAIIQYERARIRAVMMEFAAPGSHILELNCGTGEDAVFFAGKGYQVHATDISKDMLGKLSMKIQEYRPAQKISFEQCSFLALDQLSDKGPYDAIFSNFGGLNCTDGLAQVLGSFNTLLRPGGIACLVILPKFSLQETLLLLKGKFRTATRRFFSSKGTQAHIEGQYFKCWYYNPAYVKKILQDDFTVLAVEGLCTFVPPSYIESFAEKHPRLFRFLKKTEDKYKRTWPWRSIGDYYIIVLQKK